MNDDRWDFKKQIVSAIQKNGGWINAHAHFDRAYTISPSLLHQAHALLEQKWTLVDGIKKASSEDDYTERIEKAVQSMVHQGVIQCATFIDVDPLSQMRALNAAVTIKKKYKNKLKLSLINQVLKGVVTREGRRWAEKALEYVDIIGGLPSKDRPNHEKHLDIIFGWAKQTGKMVHVHIDQENNPNERDTEILAKKVIKHGLEGKVVAIHAVSLASQNQKYRRYVYKLMKAAGLSVVCCPSAALSMKAVSEKAPTHNSIAPVPELLEAGIPVAIGTDNIADIYQPMVDGDLYTELRFLAETCRFYDIDKLVEIATRNGTTTLGGIRT